MFPRYSQRIHHQKLSCKKKFLSKEVAAFEPRNLPLEIHCIKHRAKAFPKTFLNEGLNN